MGLERTAKQVDNELDEMCRQIIELMDDYYSNMSKLQHCIRDGCVHLAKSRYLMGHRSVSDLQLPTSGQYTARSTVVREEDTTVIHLACNNDGDDPIKRFGVLVPGSLRKAQEGFCKCVEYSIEAAVIKAEMEKVQKNFLSLKNERNQMTNVVNKGK
ncbi:unnamed protein product [Macrosiphum euphorbiae]|uniref:Vacuolar ATPase assembly protein VMA22 n=1 Tax=Macrosiphum euphorbiae TaxID=13131 RepID=A0AAV0W6P3_9HEMI|nr:unnamed protein product [Macrosiphum euphorbiae]